jgi:glutaredoxin
MKIFGYIFATVLIGLGGFVSPLFAQSDDVTIYFFGRNDCGHCAEEKEFLNEYIPTQTGVTYQYFNVTEDASAKALYEQVLAKHELSHVTPVTVIGDQVFQGFDMGETTGAQFASAVVRTQAGDIRTLEDHLARAPKQSDSFHGSRV